MRKNELFFFPLSMIPDHLNLDPDSEQYQCLLQVRNWVTEFIAIPNSSKGKPGPVCPKVPLALKQDVIYIAYLEIPSEGISDNDLEQLVKDTKDHYYNLPPLSGTMVEYKTCLVVFSVQSEEFYMQLERVQRALKIPYLELGLMFGKFHPELQSRGMHNEHFRPHQSPYPSFAVRVLAETDATNLTGSSAPEDTKKDYLEIYMRHWDGKAKPKYIDHVREYLEKN